MQPVQVDPTRPTLVPDPPQPRGLPILGNLVALSRSGLLPFVSQMWREHGDIFSFQAAGRRTVVVAHPNVMEQVLSTQRENYVKGNAYDGIRLIVGQGLLTLEGDAWKQRRLLEQPSFHRASIQKLVGAMSAITARTLDRWRERFPLGGTFEAHEEMMRLTLEVVGETLFGQELGASTTDASGRAFGVALELISTRGNSPFQLPLMVPTPSNVRLRRALELLNRTTYNIIDRARAARDGEATPTLLSMLLDVRDADTGQPLSNQDLRNEVITLFFAGHETTALTMTWGIDLLSRHPAVVERMRAEVDSVLGGRVPTAEDLQKLTYVRQVIDEILRLRPPAWIIARNAVADDILGGFRVRAGDLVIPAIYFTHRHPDFWEDPERFDPDRFSPERSKGRNHWSYLPFSLGPRMCIGNIFSLVESQIILAMFLQHLDLRRTTTKDVPIKPIGTLRPAAPMPVELRWRHRN